ncbi:MAG TPA: DUF2344 domain-containing protein [Candidatus Limnocylindrales bacterium]|nr:DUF2344 domain-containing protein [Candidatus Limnocylindrales bacterium]
MGQREEADLWAAALAEAPLTIVRSGVAVGATGEAEGGRPRLAFGPALPAAAEATDEPLEFELAERATAADVRAAVEASLPPGRGLVDLHDVWIGAPSLPALARALEYRLEVEADVEADVEAEAVDRLSAAVATLLASSHLPRARTRGSRGGSFDLRPLVGDLAVAPREITDAGRAMSIRFVARVDPALGVGRPDDLLAALSDLVGLPLVATRMVRTRVHLADE